MIDTGKAEQESIRSIARHLGCLTYRVLDADILANISLYKAQSLEQNPSRLGHRSDTYYKTGVS